jgi:SAM-dependent methyltransferase
VSALDAAPGLIEYACGRVPAAAFVVGDLEDLPFPDRTFDVVTAFNSVLYASDAARAIAEIARVTGARGRVVLTMGTGSASATCAAMIDPLLPPDVEASSRTTLNLQDPDRTREVLARVGLLVLEQREIAFVTTFADLDDAVRTQLPAGPVEAAVRHSGRDAVVAALCSFFAPGTAADGTVLMPSAYRFVLAERARP